MTCLSTVGFGDIHPNKWETRLWSVIILSFSLFLNAYILSAYLAPALRGCVMKEKLAQKRRKLAAVMKFYRVPWEIQKQVFTIYPYVLERGMKDMREVAELPEYLQHRIYSHIKVHLLSSVPLLERASPRCAVGGYMGWVGSRLAPKVVTHGQCARTSPARLGTPLWLSGLTAVQTADDPRTPPRRWWEGDAAVPVCPRALGSCGGGGGHSRQGHTFVVLQWDVVGVCGGLCVPGAPGPSSGAWVPYHVPYHVAAEGVCGSGDRQLPPAHD